MGRVKVIKKMEDRILVVFTEHQTKSLMLAERFLKGMGHYVKPFLYKKSFNITTADHDIVS